ncbi:MAG TPA: hypothetical protein VN828_18575 [Acidobacteriaceae bacterium]|nr:hypothetical protein [Acidobacteriaceae bacterium]
MSNGKLSTRIQISLIALAATYIVGGVSVGFRFWDVRIFLMFLFWSLPFFAVAWIVAGVPIVAAGNVVLKIPVILVWVAGAAAGVFIVMLLPLVDWIKYLLWPTPGISRSISLPWSYLKGWPAFCAALGAGGAALYRWLLSRVISQPLEAAEGARRA